MITVIDCLRLLFGFRLSQSNHIILVCLTCHVLETFSIRKLYKQEIVAPNRFSIYESKSFHGHTGTSYCHFQLADSTLCKRQIILIYEEKAPLISEKYSVYTTQMKIIMNK